MPVQNYSLFKGWVVERQLATFKNPHYQLHAIDLTGDYRISLNVFSSLDQAGCNNMTLSQVEFALIEDFQHPITAKLESLEPGLYPLDYSGSYPAEGLALDYIQGDYFDPKLMRPLPVNLPGLSNSLNEYLDKVITEAISDRATFIYVFGSRWGPESGQDKFFGFYPGNGLHDIHMNQGNGPGIFAKDNGVCQDGALFLQLVAKKRWVAIFLKFQQQSWDTPGNQKCEPGVEYHFLCKKEKNTKQKSLTFPTRKAHTHLGAKKHRAKKQKNQGWRRPLANHF